MINIVSDFLCIVIVKKVLNKIFNRVLFYRFFMFNGVEKEIIMLLFKRVMLGVGE